MTAALQTVLLVEDTALLAQLLSDAMQAHQVADEVKVFQTGQAFELEAAEMLLDGRAISLVVLDINLEDGESGLDVGRTLRSLEAQVGTNPAPIVFFSGCDEDDDVANAVADCFPARFVSKTGSGGAMRVAIEGAKLIRELLPK